MKGILILISIIQFSVLYSHGQSTVLGNFNFEGINRTYRIYIPAIYNSTVPVPLVLNLHGYGSNALEQELYTNFKSIADTANVIVVNPNGTVDGFGNQNWNTFGISNVNDLGFISALIDTISSAYNIDANSIYSTGMSNGGFMSHKLGCNSNRIAAIASVTGTLIWNEFNNCSPAQPIPVMQIHGTADGTIPYNGSALFVPVDSIIALWVNHNNCDITPILTFVPDISNTDNCTAENYKFENGANGSEVELYKIIGGGHSWPGAPVNINVTNQDFNASVEIWKFFRKFKLNILTSTEEVYSETQFYNVYPNPSGGNFTIRFTDRTLKKIVITDVFGKIMHTSICMECEFFHTFIEDKGLYIINIEGIGSTYQTRIIIQ